LLTERILVGALWPTRATVALYPKGRDHEASARVFERRGFAELPVISLW
jgi:hypothetical protein